MKLIFCLDDQNGLTFNMRRQSMDCVLRADMLNLVETNSSEIWMNQYSASQFDAPLPDFLHITDSGMDSVPEDEYFFTENICPGDADFQHTNELIIYRWNRLYPSDVKIDIPSDQDSFILYGYAWKKTSCEEFEGYSHELITRFIFTHSN